MAANLRAIASAPTTGLRSALTTPPPSATVLASGVRRPTRASMSWAAQASLNSRTISACSAAGVPDACDAATRRRALDASCRHAAGVRPTTSATSTKE